MKSISVGLRRRTHMGDQYLVYSVEGQNRSYLGRGFSIERSTKREGTNKKLEVQWVLRVHVGVVPHLYTGH